MKNILDKLSKLALLISMSSIVAMTAIISYQVVARYFFNASPAWSERLSLVLLGYLVFFGAAVGVHERFHIRIDALRDAVSPRLAKIFDVSANFAVVCAGIVMIIAGYQLTTTLWPFKVPSLGIPRGLALLPIPLSGLLITLFAGSQLIEDVRTKTDIRAKTKEAK